MAAREKKSSTQPGLGARMFMDGATRAQVQNQQPDSIPGMFKPGEFVLPPDTVHAMGGVKALQNVVDATHTPAPRSAVEPRGVPPQFRPEMFFADGGLVNGYAPGTRGADLLEKERARQAQNAAAGTALVDAIKAPFGKGETPSGQRLTDPVADPVTSSPAPVAPNPTDQRLAAGTQTTPPAPSTAPAAASTAASGNVTKTVGPDGRVAYSGGNISGDVSINGQAPGGSTGFVSAQNDTAATNLVGGWRPEMAALASKPGPGLGVAPLGVTAPTIQHSGNNWMNSHQLRDLQVSAGSITNNGGRFDQHRGESPASLAYRAALGADLKAQGQQGEADVAAMRENAGLQRTGMHEQGANQRSLVQAGLEQQRIDQTGQAQGLANRQASLLQNLRDQIAAEKDPTKRSGLVQQLRDVQGQEAAPAFKSHVLPNIRNGDGSTTMGGVYQENTRTGEGRWVPQPGQGGAQPSALSNPATRPAGTVSTVNGKSAVWDGQKWVPRA